MCVCDGGRREKGADWSGSLVHLASVAALKAILKCE